MNAAQLSARLDALPGHIGLYYEDLTTGDTFAYHADEAFSAASIIKLPMMAAIARKTALGEAQW